LSEFATSVVFAGAGSLNFVPAALAPPLLVIVTL
jgi:hypothetical protein